ncbi:unnamed protein product [Nesidiocoris tenuis]|uniref:Uncharacterized protein n=1 Tax=Nesidiocoris tenuis TaxID=355587 RepID=A0A6H5HQX9_9HEMI|nr:unnamed protein product [Nesidiocoris tenuis]
MMTNINGSSGCDCPALHSSIWYDKKINFVRGACFDSQKKGSIWMCWTKDINLKVIWRRNTVRQRTPPNPKWLSLLFYTVCPTITYRKFRCRSPSSLSGRFPWTAMSDRRPANNLERVK